MDSLILGVLAKSPTTTSQNFTSVPPSHNQYGHLI